MTENKTETLTDDQLVELAKDLIEDHDDLQDQNVTNDDMVKILANVDDEFVKSMISSKYQVVYGTGLLVSVNYLLRDLAAVSIAEALKDIVNSNGRELLPSDQIYYEGLIENLKERQEEQDGEQYGCNFSTN